MRRLGTRIFSDGSLTKKASLNSLAIVADFAARTVVGFVVNPILVRSLGDVGFGNWQVLQRLVGHANPAGGRPGEALKWFVANRQSSTDLEDKRRAVGSAIAVWLLFVPILALVGGVLGWFTPIWLHVPSAAFPMVRLAAAILVADLILSGLTSIPWAVVQGQNLGYKRLGMTTSLEFVGGGFLVIAVALGGGLVGLALAGIAATLLSGALYLWIVRSYVPWFGVARPDLRAVGRFIRLSWWFLLWNLVTKVTMGADVIVLGIAGSSQEATTYTLARFVPLTITAAVTSLISGAMPGLGGLVGAGELARGARVRSETMSFAWLIAAVGGAGILLWERSFLTLWVGVRYYPGLGPVFLIVLMVLQLTLIRVDSNIIDLTLELRWKVLLGLLAAGISVAIAWVLVSNFGLGIAGLVAGFMIGRTVQSIAYPVMIGRILGIPLQTQLKGAIRPGLTTACLLGVATALSAVVTASTWVGLVLAGGVSIVGASSFAFFLGLPRGQRRQLWDRVRRVAKLR
ncbi:MAG: lipopolysaccharide biosynthesis protein [Actinomycetota bacterium]|nr:lipopolysaccharide biosynthesis protein [Actinomycetota bacterium]